MLNLVPIPAQTEQIGHEVIGCALRVHRELGPGLLERLYQNALAIELAEAGLSFETQKPVNVSYRGQIIGVQRLDFLVDTRVLVELKIVSAIDYVHKAQVLSYLRSSGLRLGLLINFNVGVLKDGIRRVVL